MSISKMYRIFSMLKSVFAEIGNTFVFDGKVSKKEELFLENLEKLVQEFKK